MSTRKTLLKLLPSLSLLIALVYILYIKRQRSLKQSLKKAQLLKSTLAK